MDLFQSWRKHDVIKREWVYQLEDNFTKVKDKYVYERVSGIKRLLSLLRSLNEQSEVAVFMRIQNNKEHNIALHLLAFVLQNLPVPILDQALKPFPRVIFEDPTQSSTSGGSTSNTIEPSMIIKDSVGGTFNEDTGQFDSVVINKTENSFDKNEAFDSMVINKTNNTDTYNSDDDADDESDTTFVVHPSNTYASDNASESTFVVYDTIRSANTYVSDNASEHTFVVHDSYKSDVTSVNTFVPHDKKPYKSDFASFNSFIIDDIINSDTITHNSVPASENTRVVHDTNQSDSKTYNSIVDDTFVVHESYVNTTYNSSTSDFDSSAVFNDEDTDGDYNTIGYNDTIPAHAAQHPPLTLRTSEGGTKVYANPSTTEERALALELLQGVCLMHPISKNFLFENGILPLLVLLLDAKDDTPEENSASNARNVPYSNSAIVIGVKVDEPPKKEANYPRKQEIMATLDALLCLLVDHEPLQKQFLDLKGVEVCVRVLKNPAFGREVRAKCVVFLVYLVRYFHEHSVKLTLVEIFGEQLANVLLKSVRLGQPSDLQTIPGESFLDALDKNMILMNRQN